MKGFEPALAEAARNARRTGRIRVWREVSADTETPVSAFLKIRRPPWGFLLESVEGGERVGRYSFLGAGPSAVFTARGRTLEERRGDRVTVHRGDPLEIMRAKFGRLRVPEPGRGLPRFDGGLVGFAGYDTVRLTESLPDRPRDDLKVPDMVFMLCEEVLVFDRVRHTIRIIAHADARGGVEQAYEGACRRVEAIQRRLSAPAAAPISFAMGTPPGGDAVPNMTRARFESSVRRAKRHIRKGDIIQVVLSQRFSAPYRGDAFTIYRAQRMLNPSPYMFFLECGGVALAGSSPELLVRLEGDEVEVRPIAGTRRRGGSEAEDLRLEKALLADPKERAEHVMLVDLGRNDLGRVCRYGTVRVADSMYIERYSHVMHLVSSVKGRLRPGLDAFAVLRSCFPAGTVSGAPKVRAMEIIDELEPSSRGPYAGAVGYFGFSGNMDTAIAIRSVTVTGGMAHMQSGMGIVADSVPSREYAESLAKARAALLAISAAQGVSK